VYVFFVDSGARVSHIHTVYIAIAAAVFTIFWIAFSVFDQSAFTQMLCEPILNLNYQLIWYQVRAASVRDHVSHYQKGFKLEAGEFRYANYTISN
jgi:hypothetical protein